VLGSAPTALSMSHLNQARKKSFADRERLPKRRRKVGRGRGGKENGKKENGIEKERVISTSFFFPKKIILERPSFGRVLVQAGKYYKDYSEPLRSWGDRGRQERSSCATGVAIPPL